MTNDVIALLRGEPNRDALLRGLLAAGPQLRVGAIAEGAALQLFDDDRTLVATVELPAQIRVPGEAERLLDVTDPPAPPYWWVEIRCPTAREDAVPVAVRLAQALAAELDGVVWRTPGSS